MNKTSQKKEAKTNVEHKKEERVDKGCDTWKTDRNILNRKCEHETAEEEIQDRNEVATEALKVYKRYIPEIIKDLSEIEDPRKPERITHKISLLMLYGILIFVYHMSSRRDANTEITAVFKENIRAFFPEFEDLPHSCTLARLLERIEVKKIEEAAKNLVNRLIRDKKFSNYLVNNKYVIAIDGVHKFTREWEWCENSLKKQKKGQPKGVNQYYASALEASLVLPEGLTIPFMTEFMDRKEYQDEGTDTEKKKQDCELKAFKRLASRLKEYFPKLKIVLTLDGLYANGPLMELCKENGWDYMITLKDGSLKTVWEDIEGLRRNGMVEKFYRKLTTPDKSNVEQEYWWVNNIEYKYGDNDGKNIKVNVVVCLETRKVKNRETGEEIETKTKFAWISSKEITQRNVEKRCNLIGRPRWNIETQNLVEKHHGYAYKHCFSYNWNAMKGYHYLMHLGHIINTLTLYSTEMIKRVKKNGVRRTIKLIFLAFKGCILDIEKIKEKIDVKYQIRLAI